MIIHTRIIGLFPAVGSPSGFVSEEFEFPCFPKKLWGTTNKILDINCHFPIFPAIFWVAPFTSAGVNSHPPGQPCAVVLQLCRVAQRGAQCLLWSGDWILHSTSRCSFGSPGSFVGCAAWKISSASCLELSPWISLPSLWKLALGDLLMNPICIILKLQLKCFS